MDFSFLFNLALSYSPKKLPFQYHCRNTVSQLSSRWISVVPVCYEHQDLEKSGKSLISKTEIKPSQYLL